MISGDEIKKTIIKLVLITVLTIAVIVATVTSLIILY